MGSFTTFLHHYPQLFPSAIRFVRAVGLRSLTNFLTQYTRTTSKATQNSINDWTIYIDEHVSLHLVALINSAKLRPQENYSIEPILIQRSLHFNQPVLLPILLCCLLHHFFDGPEWSKIIYVLPRAFFAYSLALRNGEIN